MTQWRGEDGLRVLMDHGPLGYLSIAAHGNADANALSAWIGDRPLFTDPGTYLYHSGGIWRDWFRGTPSHSTLNIAGADQSVISGPFNWSHKARAHLIGTTLALTGPSRPNTTATRNASVCVTSAVWPPPRGLCRYRPPQRDDRSAGRDRLATARGGHGHRDGAGDRDRRPQGPLARLVLPEGGRVEIREGTGDQPGQGGWVSPRFGVKVPAPRIAWTGPLPEAGLTSRVTRAG